MLNPDQLNGHVILTKPVIWTQQRAIIPGLEWQMVAASVTHWTQTTVKRVKSNSVNVAKSKGFIQFLEEDMSIMNVMFRNKNAAASHLMLQDNLYRNSAVLYPCTVIKVIFFPQQHCHTFSLKVFLLSVITFIDVFLRINAATVEIKEQGPFLCFCDVFKEWKAPFGCRRLISTSQLGCIGDALPLFLHPRTLWAWDTV